MKMTRRQALAMLATSMPMAAGRVAASQITPEATPAMPEIDPATFSTSIDHRFLPLIPGTVFTYDGTSDGEEQRNIVTVTSEIRRVMGVDCVVVRDQVFAGETLLEDTYDWYAQDADGNVWYFGEDSTAYEDGKVNKEGSWESGVDGAVPGIVMEAAPAVGDSYRQEYLAGAAEDMAEVLKTGESVTVPYGSYTDVLVTKEWTPLEPGVVEHKSYAPDIGMVLSEMVQGGQERFELVDMQKSAPATPVG